MNADTLQSKGERRLSRRGGIRPCIKNQPGSKAGFVKIWLCIGSNEI